MRMGTFFTELTAFLRQLEREGAANLSFADYALECLCVAVVCVSNMQSVLIAAESDHRECCTTTLQ